MSRSKMLPIMLIGIPWVALPMACKGERGDPGAPAPTTIDASTASSAELADLDVVTEITRVFMAGQPRVDFTVKTAQGVPITGIRSFWEASNSFVRFTITKLVPGQNNDPDSWVAYVRDGGEPDYDTGASLVDHRNGTYTFTFATNVQSVAGVPYESSRTHRVAGQIGSGSVALEAQNLVYDFVPNGAQITRRRDIAVMESCNECHDNLVFHGRRFETQYCTQCHNPDLASGEGDFAFMIHRIHSAGDFAVLGGGSLSYAEVTYPQSLADCRKCHNGADADTPQGNNWQEVPNIAACDGCHNVFATMTHSGPALTNNLLCIQCHGPGMAESIEMHHANSNKTPNNPMFPSEVGWNIAQRDITYEMMDATVGGGVTTVRFKLMDGMTALDPTNLPADMVNSMTMEAFRYPALLLAWTMTQDGITSPADFSNVPQRAGQPISLSLADFSPIETVTPIGTLAFNAGDGVTTATIMDAGSQFPGGATMRAVALEGYFQQSRDADGTDAEASLHTPSVMTNVTGDSARRVVVDSAKCSNCHEWFEGHGGSRVLGYGSDIICTLCHNPNLSSTGRTVTNPALRGLNTTLATAIANMTLDPSVDSNDPTTYPEDAQNFKDLIHGIHSADDRTRAFQHVRGPSRQDYFDWQEITFPRGASTAKCTLCHRDPVPNMRATWALPLPDDLLPTTVRTTGQADGLDASPALAEAAFAGLPNPTDWVNSPTAGSCFYCHTSPQALAHMNLNGGLLSDPWIGGDLISNRSLVGTMIESCSVCHGPGKSADLELVHDF